MFFLARMRFQAKQNGGLGRNKFGSDRFDSRGSSRGGRGRGHSGGGGGGGRGRGGNTGGTSTSSYQTNTVAQSVGYGTQQPMYLIPMPHPSNQATQQYPMAPVPMMYYPQAAAQQAPPPPPPPPPTQ